MSDDPYFTYPVSSWDNNASSTSLDPSKNVQNAPALSLGRKTELVPVSRYTSQTYPPYNTNERQIQQYRQSKPLIETSSSSQKSIITKNKTGVSEWCEKHITITRVIGLLVGMIICGVPLIVVITLYAQYTTASGSATGTNTASSTVSTSYVLPYQCTTYSTNSDATRNAGYGLCSGCYCDSSMYGWYRFTGSAGTRLATSPVPVGFCGTSYPVWFNGTLPTAPGTTTIGIECINYYGYICYPSYSTATILATNCNGFYVFYLSSITVCYSRFCTV